MVSNSAKRDVRKTKIMSFRWKPSEIEIGHKHTKKGKPWSKGIHRFLEYAEYIPPKAKAMFEELFKESGIEMDTFVDRLIAFGKALSHNGVGNGTHSVKRKLSSRRYAEWRNKKKRIIACSRDWISKSKTYEVSEKMCDTCYNSAGCPCKQFEPAIVIEPTQFNGANVQQNVKRLPEKRELRTIQTSPTEIIEHQKTPLKIRLKWMQNLCVRQLSFHNAADDSYCHTNCRLVHPKEYEACMDLFNQWINGETIEDIANSPTL